MVTYNNNKKNILSILRTEGAKTKFDLANILNISIPTVTYNVNELMRDKIVISEGVSDVAYGRKPLLINLNHNHYLTLGIDIQDNILSCSVMDLHLNIVSSSTFQSKKNDFFNTIKNAIRETMLEYSKKVIVGIGISYPGVVEKGSMILKTATTIGTDYIDLTPLSTLFKTPIYITNEANLASFSELVMGNKKELNNCVYLSINRGLGGSIVLNGKYYNGKHNLAGEVGHMTIQKDGNPCNCGAFGCAEAYLSTASLIKTFNTAHNLNIQSLNELFKVFDTKDISHINILYEYIDYLVILINNLFLTLDPMYIIIGGELSLYKSFYATYLCSKLEECKFSKIISPKKHLLYSSLGHNSSKYGACLEAFKNIINFK